MFKKILHFIKYNNAFAIGIMVVFVGFSISLAASPEARHFFVSSEEKVYSKDNSYLLAANLDNWDFDLKIKDIKEDAKNYYVIYQYDTIAVYDYVWKRQTQEDVLTVSKALLQKEKADLGLYAAGQLSQVIEYELDYLQEVQEDEQEKGLTKKLVSKEYSGLIGKHLNPKEEEFPGYVAVVKPEIETEQIEEEIQPEPEPAEPAEPVINRELIVQIINEMIDERGLVASQEIEGQIQQLVSQGVQQEIDLLALEEQAINNEPVVTEVNTDTDTDTETDTNFENEDISSGEQTNQTIPNTQTSSTTIPTDIETATTTQASSTDTQISTTTPTEIATTSQATSTTQAASTTPEIEATSTEATSTEPCVPNWECSAWQPELTEDICGQTVVQTRECADLNNCGLEQGKPEESQQVETAACVEEIIENATTTPSE